MKVICNCCGKKLLTYNNSSCCRYESPIKNCKKCQKQYIDPRSHEIAVEGLQPYQRNNVCLVVAIVAEIIVQCLDLELSAAQRAIKGLVLLVISVVILVSGIKSIVYSIPPVWEYKHRKMKAESETRMKSQGYVNKLIELGYEIPDVFFEKMESHQ